MTSVVAGLQSRGNHNRDCNEIVNDWGRAQNQKKMCKLFFFFKNVSCEGKEKDEKKKKTILYSLILRWKKLGHVERNELIDKDEADETGMKDINILNPKGDGRKQSVEDRKKCVQYGNLMDAE